MSRRALLLIATSVALNFAPTDANAALCDGNTPVPVENASAEQQSWASPIGVLRTSSLRYCTASLIAPNVAITAGHCFEGSKHPQYTSSDTPQDICDDTRIQFDYQHNNGVLNSTGPEFQCLEVLEQGFATIGSGDPIDVTLIRLEGNPGEEFGVLDVNATWGDEAADLSDQLTIIHHMNGDPKVVSTGQAIEANTFYLFHELSTEGGSSGAPILDEEGRLVGIHTAAALGSCSSGNEGFRLKRLGSETDAMRIARFMQRDTQTATQDGDNFGGALAAGDFNGDGVDDLAAAGRYAAGSTLSNPGGITSWNGVENVGLDGASALNINQSVLTGPETGDGFGEVMAVADFNGDGFDDLAVSAPGESVWTSDGSVHILFGGELGITGVTQTLLAPPAAQGADAQFGAALATGDFDCDGFEDLAIGAPGADGNRGAVSIFLGRTGHMRRGWEYTTDELDLRDVEDPFFFGASLAAGHFDGDPPAPPESWHWRGPLGCDDLAIGIPFGSTPGAAFSGATVIVNSAGGGNGLGYQDTTVLTAPSPQAFAFYGITMGADRFLNIPGGYDTLVVAATGQDDVALNAGAAYTYRGYYGISEFVTFLRNSTGSPQMSNDQFGSVIAFADLLGGDPESPMQALVGTQWADDPGVSNAGYLSVMLGEGAASWEAVDVVRSTPGLEPKTEGRFASALAAGDFDADGVDEVAIGVEGYDLPTGTNVGGVLIRKVDPPTY